MRYINHYILITIVFSHFACESILNRQPLDKISSSDVWTDQQLIDANLGYLYASTPLYYSENSINITQPAYMGAETYVHDAANSWIQGTLDETGGVWEFWAYEQIRELNTFIKNVATAPIDENIREIRVAEARFLRAFNYFEMVKRYGGVPLITEPQELDVPEEELYVSRNSEKEIYDFIAKECEAIGTALPDVADEYGRATRYTALALKSRAMLYAASIGTYGRQQLNGLLGFPEDESDNYWQSSYDASLQIVNSGLFSLYNGQEDKTLNFQELFLDEQNSETIFAKVYTGIGEVGHSFDYYNYPAGFEMAWGGTTSIYLEMVEAYEYTNGKSGKLDYDSIVNNEISFEELFSNKDPRFFASVLYPGATFQDGKVYCHNGTYINGELNISSENIGEYAGDQWVARAPAWNKNYVVGTGFPIKKLVNENEPQAQSGESNTDYIVFRYAEILLNLAESAFELGKKEDAIHYINEIRKRAGITLLDDIDRSMIRNERRVELAFEGHRFWDLRRWRNAEEELSKEMHGIRTNFNWDTKKYEINIESADVVSRGFEEKHYYFPITVNRISNNPNLAPENPGY